VGTFIISLDETRFWKEGVFGVTGPISEFARTSKRWENTSVLEVGHLILLHIKEKHLINVSNKV